MVRKMMVLSIVPVLLVAGMAMAQRGRESGCWRLAAAAPTTPAQKAYVADATALHTQIREAQGKLLALRAEKKPAQPAIKAKQAELDGLRVKLQALNLKNRGVILQLLPKGTTAGPGSCGICPNAGTCVCLGQCPCPGGGAACANCPFAGTCVCPNGAPGPCGPCVSPGSGPGSGCPMTAPGPGRGCGGRGPRSR